MFRLSLISLTIAVLLPFAAQAGDAEAGKALYEPCIACHGPNAEGMPALNSPGLAGQSESYLMRQLWDFKKGNRGAAEGDTIGAQMRPMAMTLADGQAIANVSAKRSKLGATQNRLEHVVNNLSVAVENLTASESRIRDTDMAMEMANFTKHQILSQAGTAMLAQANAVPQNVLTLLR